MKKIISLILCAAVICFSFCSCSGPNTDMTEENITATVKEAEAALKEFDIKKLEKYVDSSTLSTILNYAKEHEQFVELGKAMFANLEMEITNIDLENETVTISVKNKDLFKAARDFADELKSQYTAIQLMTKLSDDKFLDVKLNTLCKQIEECELIPDSIEMTLSIEKGKKNLVLYFNTDAENAVSGGALKAIKSIY